MQLEKNLQAPLLRATSEASLLRKARDPPIGPLGRLFFKHKNRRFGDDLELAARSAFVVVLLSIPLMVRENEVPPAVSFLSQHNLYGPTTVLYFIFAIGANLDSNSLGTNYFSGDGSSGNGGLGGSRRFSSTPRHTTRVGSRRSSRLLV